MGGWYGHTISLEINDKISIPKYNGKLPLVNKIIGTESERLKRKLNYAGARIVNEIALSSQTFQRNTITELGAVDTGRLRESVRITGTPFTANIGTDLYYAETVHDIGYQNQTIFNINGLIIRGHSDIGPRPWVDSSADRLANEIDTIVVGELNRIY